MNNLNQVYPARVCRKKKCTPEPCPSRQDKLGPGPDTMLLFDVDLYVENFNICMDIVKPASHHNTFGAFRAQVEEVQKYL